MVANGSCSICTELFDLSGADGTSIAVVPCGHTFHYHCLLSWMQTKLNCPECRKAFRRNSVIEKLYFNVEETDTSNDNPATLRNELDSLKCQLRVKDKDKADLRSANETLSRRMDDLKAELVASKAQYSEERHTNKTLVQELKYHKSLVSEAEEAKKEAYRLQKKLNDLKAVERVLSGNQEEVEERISLGDKEQLATFAVIIRKELEMKKTELKTLRNDSFDLKKKLSERNSKLKETREKAKQLEHDLEEVESKNDSLKNKIQKLEQALGSPSDAAVSFASRLIHESPAPCGPSQKRPKLTTPSEDLFMSPDLPSRKSSASQLKKSVSPQADLDDLPVSYLNFTNASSSSSSSSTQLNKKAKGALKEPSNIANVSGLGGFNLFKKSNGSGLLNRDSGKIRTGYNGLGGHEKHVEGSGRPFEKITTTKAKRKTPFAAFKSLQTPALPTLDTFLDT